MERELIVERTVAGLAAARAKGRVGGRRPKLTTEQWAQIGRLLEAGESRQRIALILMWVFPQFIENFRQIRAMNPLNQHYFDYPCK